MSRRASRGVTSGIGVPTKMEGKNGDLTIRRTKEGKILFVKEHNAWHPLNTGIDINQLRQDVDRLKRSASLFGINDHTSGGGHRLNPQYESILINKTNTAAAAIDPKIKFSVGGTDKFVMGVDDSASGDPFKIDTGGAIGGATKLTMDSSGNVDLAASNLKLGTGATGVLLKNNAGVLQVRNVGDSADVSVQCASIKDDAGQESIDIAKTTNAVNYLRVKNSISGTPFVGPTITVAGADTDTSLMLEAKGNGIVQAIRETEGDGAENATGLRVDFDRTVASSGTNAHNDIGIDLDVNSASLGTSSVKGMDIDIVGATSGTHTATGIELNVSGADTNEGLVITNADGGTDIKLVSSADSADYCTISTTASGATTIATVDDGATVANLTLDIDGALLIDADKGQARLTDGGGAFSPAHADDIVTKRYVDGRVPFVLFSQFQDDIGRTQHYLPLAGYFESHLIGGEPMGFISPFNMTLQKVVVRCSEDISGATTKIGMWAIDSGTTHTHNATVGMNWAEATGGAADTNAVIDFTGTLGLGVSSTGGSNAVTAGQWVDFSILNSSDETTSNAEFWVTIYFLADMDNTV